MLLLPYYFLRQTTCPPCQRSHIILYSRQLTVLPNSSVSSPGRILRQPHKSPPNLSTSLILRSIRTFFPGSWTVSGVYNSHLRANIWFKQASDCCMVSIPALIIPGFLTSVFHLWHNYTFIFHFTNFNFIYCLLHLGYDFAAAKGHRATNMFHLSFTVLQFSCSQTHLCIERDG